MHIVLVYRYYNDGIVYYNLTFCAIKSLMTDLGLRGLTFEKINPEVLFYGASGRIFMLFGVLPDSNNKV